jgi:crotonobetainyl-CoA:carnitine CoA-transferase CaiB-like acyl-CoA transferase
MTVPTHRDGPLADIKVVDCATVIAGPGAARYLADFGADVIKVERPEGDTTRTMGWMDERDGSSLWWKLISRGKRTVVLDLKQPDDLERMKRLCADADVLIENFRPGTLERLGLAPDDLLAANPKLVILRVTGFGQDGPYAGRPGFATLAEAMSGFAALNGEPDGAPLLPPIALTDEVTALVGAFAVMVALHSGVGQVVDVNLLESLFQLMGALPSAYAVNGYQQPRLGSGIAYTVPRGTYRTSDDRWVAVSTSAESVAKRVMDLIGVGDDARFATFQGRMDHRDEVEQLMVDWIAARPLADVMRAFEDAQAAIAPVLDMADIAADPHYAARGTIETVDGTPMQGLVARLSKTPGRIRWAGRPPGADQDLLG